MAMNGDQGFVGFRGGNGMGQGFGGQSRNFDPKDDARGFLNFYLPDGRGEMVKVGKGVALRAGYGNEKGLDDQLREAHKAMEAGDPAAMKEMLELLLENLEIRYYPVRDESEQPKGFVLKRKTQP